MPLRETSAVIDLLALDPYVEDALQWYGATLDDEARELTLAQLCERDGLELGTILVAVRELVDAEGIWADELDAANDPDEWWGDDELYEEAS